jgi:hypothetical protein
MPEHGLGVTSLDDLAVLEDQHAVAQMLDATKNMRDEEQRCSEPRLQLGEQIEHLSLDADVER